MATSQRPDPDDDSVSHDAPPVSDQDPVAYVGDVEAEAGDEEELRDRFTEDHRAAREAGTNLDRGDGQEPELD